MLYLTSGGASQTLQKLPCVFQEGGVVVWYLADIVALDSSNGVQHELHSRAVEAEEEEEEEEEGE